jgi:hypothetical protein
MYLPELITLEASNIRTNSAVSGGFIPNDGGGEISVRGICWGTAANPSISGSKINKGTGMGKFTCTLAGLNQNTLYYARAYATNSEGTAYGNEIQFTTTLAVKPTVATHVQMWNITFYSAWVQIQIISDGGTPLIEKGVCWETNKNPTVDDEKYIIDDPDVNYMGYMSPLKPSSCYHVRAYAINCIGISYGNDVSITTLAVPEITTSPATEVTRTSARVGGNVISFGDADGAEVGICYGTAENPTIEDSHFDVMAGIGEFTLDLTNLVPGTLYYVRAYVAWGWDDWVLIYNYTLYGNQVTFTTEN